MIDGKKLVELRDHYSKSRVERLIGLREAIISGPEEVACFANKKHMSENVVRQECETLKKEGIWPFD